MLASLAPRFGRRRGYSWRALKILPNLLRERAQPFAFVSVSGRRFKLALVVPMSTHGSSTQSPSWAHEHAVLAKVKMSAFMPNQTSNERGSAMMWCIVMCCVRFWSQETWTHFDSPCFNEEKKKNRIVVCRSLWSLSNSLYFSIR